MNFVNPVKWLNQSDRKKWLSYRLTRCAGVVGAEDGLFNRSNVASVNTGQYGIASSSATVLTNPAATAPFGGARTFLGERQMQLAIKFKF